MMKFYDLRKRLCEERDISDLHCSGPGDDAGTVQITAFTRRIEVRPETCEYIMHLVTSIPSSGITYMLGGPSQRVPPIMKVVLVLVLGFTYKDFMFICSEFCQYFAKIVDTIK